MSMSSQEILERYFNFYKERGHVQIPNVSLVPENDPTLLFVNSGMFPLVPYLSGQQHPMGSRLMNVQRSLRFEDIEEIGDKIHTVAFHMIGNWSLGDYFKNEQLPWAYEFLIDVLGLDPSKLYATVFSGNDLVERDKESFQILKEIFSKYKIPSDNRILFPDPKENWWKRGEAVGELGGPDSEVFYYIGEGLAEGKDPYKNETEFVEIGNSVFMQYRRTEDGWEELPQKNVDFGGGLERIALAVQGKTDIFETDNFWPIIQKIEEISGKKYKENNIVTKSMRILADHVRASVFLGMDGVLPSNKDQGYILRRLLRRMTRAGMSLGVDSDLSVSLVGTVVENFKWLYPALVENQFEIERLFVQEEEKFRKTLRKGKKEVEKVSENIIKAVNDGDWDTVVDTAFSLFSSHGYPVEIFVEDFKDMGAHISLKEFESRYDARFKAHQDESRAGSDLKFKGGLADHSEKVIQYHTATHLLHWALREVLGSEVSQQGSNITSERLRFDFSWGDKLSDTQIAKVADLINQKIKENLPVKFEIMSREDADRTGALHFFGEKYGDMVKVYYIGESLGSAVSKEFCGGPHVEQTGSLNEIILYKQEKIGGGNIRIYAKFKEQSDA